MPLSKKIVACILSVLALMLSSCAVTANSEANKPSEVSKPPVKDSNEHIDYEDLTAEAWLSSMESYDYNGYRFTICTSKDDRFDTGENETGVVNPTLAKRNALIEQKFNIRINEVLQSEDRIVDNLKIAKSAGIQFADMVSVSMPAIATCAASGYLMNLFSVPFFDSEAEYMDTQLIKECTVNNSLYCFFDKSTLYQEQLCCVFYNKDLFKSNVSDEIIASVKDGSWTWQKLITLAEEAARETIEKRSPDLQNDVFGLVSYEGTDGFRLMLYKSAGVSLFSDTYHTPLSYTLDSKIGDKTAKAIKNITLSKSFLPLTNEEASKAFLDGRAAFFVCKVDFAQAASDSSVNWQIVPLPKLDSNQEKVYSVISPAACGIAVPVHQSDSVRTGRIINALCASSNVGLEEALLANYTTFCMRDNDGALMLGRIFQDPVTDISMLYSEGFERLAALTKSVLLEAIETGTSFDYIFIKNQARLKKLCEEEFR